MHPEFAKKQNTEVFNYTKYVKQWMLIALGFFVFFTFKHHMLGLQITFGIAIFLLLSSTFLKPVFKFITIAWLKLGEFIGMVMQPIIMGIVFYLIFTPFALLFKALAKKKEKGFQKVNLSYGKEDFDQQF